MITRTIAFAAVCGLLLAAPAASAEKVVTTVDNPTPIRSWKGIGAFSIYDKDEDAYRLAITRVGAEPEVLAVAARPVPFDADVGPDTRNEPAIVYSRCEREAGERGLGRRDCDIYRYSLTRGVESRISNADSDSASEFNPSIWDGRVAWVRTYDRDEKATPYVYTRELTAPRSKRSQRLPGVPTRRCAEFDEQFLKDPCGPTTNRRVHELELYGRNLALNVTYDHKKGIGFFDTEIRLDRLDGSVRQVVRQHAGLGGQHYVGLSFDEGRLYWARTCGGDPGGCSERNAGAFRYRLSTGETTQAGHTRHLAGFSYVDDGRAYEVRATCDPMPDTPQRTCPIVLTDPLDFDDTDVRTTRLWLDNTSVNGGGDERLEGRALIRTPEEWRHLNRDAAPSAHFAAEAGPGCQARILIGARALATSDGPVEQVRAATRFAVAVIDEGRLSHGGAWRLVEVEARDGERQLYGIAALELANNRWLHIRELVSIKGDCSDQEVRSGDVARGLQELLETVRVEARIVAR